MACNFVILTVVSNIQSTLNNKRGGQNIRNAVIIQHNSTAAETAVIISHFCLWCRIAAYACGHTVQANNPKSFQMAQSQEHVLYSCCTDGIT